jgi:hypothetical protein
VVGSGGARNWRRKGEAGSRQQYKGRGVRIRRRALLLS